MVETFNIIILKGSQVKSLQSLKEKEKVCGNRRNRTEDGERDITITTIHCARIMTKENKVCSSPVYLATLT